MIYPSLWSPRLSIALTLFVASGGAWAAATAAVPQFSTPQAAAQYHILAGELAAQRQQPVEAATQLLKALDYIDDVSLAQRAALLAFSAKSDALALRAAERWLKLEPSNLEPREILLRAALRLGKTAQVQAQAEAIVRDHAAGEVEGLRHVALLLSQDKASESVAMQVMQVLQKQWPDLPGAFYAQGILAMRFGRYEEAEAAALAALKLDESSQDARLLLLGVQVKRGQIAQADQTADQLIDQGQDEAEFRLSYVKLLVDAKQNEAASAQLQRILLVSPGNEDALFGLGLIALDARDLEAATGYLQPLTEGKTHASDAAFYLGSIAQLGRDYAQALEWYEKVIDGNKALDSLFRRAAMMVKLDRMADAREVFESLRLQAPMLGSRIDSEEASLLLESGLNAEALAVLDRALKLQSDDAELLYARSLVHERNNRFTLAEKDLRRILKDSPDDPRALNALGFLLTVHTKRFAEAEKMIARALEFVPDDAAVIDSYGWVKYRRGKTQEAKATLEKAYGKLKDPEIAAHFGEVLWVLGEKARAREIWATALAEDPDHRVLKETIKRLSP